MAVIGVGTLIGGALGFMLGGPIGAGLGAMAGSTISKDEKGVMTPERQVLFQHAMEMVKDPAELQILADGFEGEGLINEAEALRRRSKLRTLPKEVKEKRRAVFLSTMVSDDLSLIEEVASAFDDAQCIDAAKALRDHADAVRARQVKIE